MMQLIMAYQQYKKFHGKQLGGTRVELETDIFVLGQVPKGGLGFKNLNKCYVQFLGEKGGDLILEPYPNPAGGSEALTQIQDLLNEFVAPESIFHSDSARAVKAWVFDHPELNLWHIIVTHSLAKFYGFNWKLFVNEEDGEIFKHLKKSSGEYQIITAGTQKADGFSSVVKKALGQRGGCRRENVRSEVKEIQWRHNERSVDIYSTFLKSWGILENDLANGIVDLEFVHSLVEWDHEVYENAPEDFPFWCCPGCGYSTDTKKKWKAQRTKHQKSCKYYTDKAVNQYEHLTSRCACCIYSYHDSIGSKIQAPKVKFYNF
jgi:hypothetical protein